MGCEGTDCYPREDSTILLCFVTDEEGQHPRMFGVRLMCGAHFKDHAVVGIVWALRLASIFDKRKIVWQLMQATAPALIASAVWTF